MDKSTEALLGDGVGATLVTTIAARANGQQRFRVPEWNDEQARCVFDRLARRAEVAGVNLEPLILKGRADVVGTIRRSQELDALTRDYSRRHPEGAQVLTIGVGLCNRASRLAELPLSWFGADRATVIALRRELIPSDATTLLAGDGAAPEILEALDPKKPTLVIAEGLLMYLTKEQVSKLLVDLSAYFSDVELCADIFDSATMGKDGTRSAAIAKSTDARYTFAASGASGLAALAPGWQVRGEIPVMPRISTMFAAINKLYSLTHKGRMMYGVAHIAAVRR